MSKIGKREFELGPAPDHAHQTESESRCAQELEGHAFCTGWRVQPPQDDGTADPLAPVPTPLALPRLAGRDFRSRSGSDSTKTARATSSGAAPASAIRSPSADQMPERPPHGSPRRTTRREPRPSAAPPRCSTAEPPCTPSLYPTITLYSGCTAGTDPAPATEPTGPVRTREATSAGARCRDSAGHRREFLAGTAKVRGERPGFHGCRPSAARR